MIRGIAASSARSTWVVHMASHPAQRVNLARISAALLAAVDVLSAEFPEVPSAVIYEKVGEARGLAARYLPDVLAYQHEIERDARLRLRFRSGSSTEVSAGTVGWP
jgi:hypothetical protein